MKGSVVIFVTSVILASVVVGCNNGALTAPTTTTPPATRIIRLAGNLQFGDVAVGTVRSDGLLTITNDGNDKLTFTDIYGPCGISGFSATPTTGVIAPGQTWHVAVKFAPTSIVDCNGALSVEGDQTAGSSTIPIGARGTLDGVQVWHHSDEGDRVVTTMPAHVKRVRVVADYGGYSANFIMQVGGQLVVNTLLGTGWNRTQIDGTYEVVNGQIETRNSSGVRWHVMEMR